jgi:hypothetical protein
MDYSSYIGKEFIDPEYRYNLEGARCPSGRRCRRSDAALVHYDGGRVPGFGSIARPYGFRDGTLYIDPYNPPFRIAAEAAFPRMGEGLDKIGSTTGWTYGEVVETCVDKDIGRTDITLFCQEVVSAHSAGGDSGAPVFRFGFGETVTLYGILWGGNEAGTQFGFSAMVEIEDELGGDLITFEPDESRDPGCGSQIICDP